MTSLEIATNKWIMFSNHRFFVLQRIRLHHFYANTGFCIESFSLARNIWITFTIYARVNQSYVAYPLTDNTAQRRNMISCLRYLNCKILHGGTLLQPWPNAFGMRKYFNGNYVILSPNLNENQKKVSGKWKCFFPEIRWRPKKRSSPQFGTIFSRNLKDLFVLASSFSSDHPALKSRWGTLNLDAGHVPPTM